MKVTLLKTDVAAKDKPREEIRILMEAWEKKNAVTVLPGCQMTPKPAHSGGFRELNIQSWEKSVAENGCLPPSRSKTGKETNIKFPLWTGRESTKEIMKHHKITAIQVSRRADWSGHYVANCLRNLFNPSPERAAEIERIVSEIVAEKQQETPHDIAA